MKKINAGSSHTVHDIIGLRVIAKDDVSCYAVLDHLVTQFSMHRCHDYIQVPKANGYQSLHCVITVDGAFIEVQIRTPRMHFQAEYGSAAHWKYKSDECEVLLNN